MRSIITDRLILRPWQQDDAHFLFDLESRQESVRYLGPYAHTMTDLEEAKESIRRRQSLGHGIYGIWLIASQEGVPLGNLLLKPVRLSQGVSLQAPIEIGWQLHQDAQGCGYATEAAKAVLDDATNRGLRTVIAIVDPNNSPSIRVCERLHMTARGITQAYYDEDSLLFDKDLGTR